jgi:hypothetical protein
MNEIELPRRVSLIVSALSAVPQIKVLPLKDTVLTVISEIAFSPDLLKLLELKNIILPLLSPTPSTPNFSE